MLRARVNAVSLEKNSPHNIVPASTQLWLRPGGHLNINMLSYLYRDPMFKIRGSHDHLIFNMGIPIPGKDGLYIETGPRRLWSLICQTSLYFGLFIAKWIQSKNLTLRPKQNGHHFANSILKCIFLKEKFYTWICFSLKFVSKGLIEVKSALVLVIACGQAGDKPLSEPKLVKT